MNAESALERLKTEKVTLSVKELMDMTSGGHAVGVNPIKIRTRTEIEDMRAKGLLFTPEEINQGKHRSK
jgi:hypothetical protein